MDSTFLTLKFITTHINTTTQISINCQIPSHKSQELGKDVSLSLLHLRQGRKIRHKGVGKGTWEKINQEKI